MFYPLYFVYPINVMCKYTAVKQLKNCTLMHFVTMFPVPTFGHPRFEMKLQFKMMMNYLANISKGIYPHIIIISATIYDI